MGNQDYIANMSDVVEYLRLRREAAEFRVKTKGLHEMITRLFNGEMDDISIIGLNWDVTLDGRGNG